MTRDEFAKDRRYRLVGDLGETLARVEPDGRIAISDAFFNESKDSKRTIIEHEMAHFVVDPASPKFWKLVDSGVLGRFNEELQKWEGIVTGRNPEETLTNLIQNAREGKPVPAEVLAEYPDLHRRT